MKRTLPMTGSPPSRLATLAFLLLLTNLLSAAAKKHPHESVCAPLRAMAVSYDADGSAGLNTTEFAQFYSAGLRLPGGGVDGTGLYDTLLCECHHSFDLHWSCCDDTAGDDDWYADEHWTEVSLAEFGDAHPGSYEKYYHKRFCKKVGEELKSLGLSLEGLDATALGPGAAPTTPAPTTAATTAEPTAESTTPAPVTASPTPAPSEAATDPRTTAVPTSGASIATGTAATATTTEVTTKPATTVATTAATTATIAELTTIPTNVPIESMERFALTFLASANGNVDEDSVDMDDIANAFWRVALDVLEEMGTRKLNSGRGSKPRAKTRQLWNYGPRAAVYFESIGRAVEDVGKSLGACACETLSYFI